MPIPSTNMRGYMNVQFTVEFPKNLSIEKKQKLRELLSVEDIKQSANFFSNIKRKLTSAKQEQPQSSIEVCKFENISKL